jgi:hypothetical protein
VEESTDRLENGCFGRTEKKLGQLLELFVLCCDPAYFD